MSDKSLHIAYIGAREESSVPSRAPPFSDNLPREMSGGGRLKGEQRDIMKKTSVLLIWLIGLTFVLNGCGLQSIKLHSLPDSSQAVRLKQSDDLYSVNVECIDKIRVPYNTGGVYYGKLEIAPGQHIIQVRYHHPGGSNSAGVQAILFNAEPGKKYIFGCDSTVIDRTVNGVNVKWSAWIKDAQTGTKVGSQVEPSPCLER